MLSSIKSDMLLFLLLHLLIATTTVQSVVLHRRALENYTTTAAAAETKATSETQPTASTAPDTATSKIIATPTHISEAPSQEKKEKNVKIIFPTNNDSAEESKFDVYGLKTTPKTNDQSNIDNTIKTAESTVETTTVVTETSNNNNTASSNSTVKSLDDRLGIFNLAPKCKEGYVIVNQHCHRRA